MNDLRVTQNASHIIEVLNRDTALLESCVMPHVASISPPLDVGWKWMNTDECMKIYMHVKDKYACVSVTVSVNVIVNAIMEKCAYMYTYKGVHCICICMCMCMHVYV